MSSHEYLEYPPTNDDGSILGELLYWLVLGNVLTISFLWLLVVGDSAIRQQLSVRLLEVASQNVFCLWVVAVPVSRLTSPFPFEKKKQKKKTES